MAFREIAIESLEFNPFTKIGKEWMLITAGDETKSNTMTASWGGLGIMWSKNVATAYIRPQRYTREFVDGSDKLSISVLPNTYRKELSYLGTVSGRNEDKISKVNLTVNYIDGTPAFKEASLTIICKKLFAQNLDMTL